MTGDLYFYIQVRWIGHWPWLSMISLSDISITVSYSMTSVSREKVLNFKEDFMSTGL